VDDGSEFPRLPAFVDREELGIGSPTPLSRRSFKEQVLYTKIRNLAPKYWSFLDDMNSLQMARVKRKSDE